MMRDDESQAVNRIYRVAGEDDLPILIHLLLISN